MAKFLDDNGLSAVWAKIKEFCAGLMAASVYDPAGKSSQVATEAELAAGLAGKSDTGHTHTADQVAFTDGETFQQKLDAGKLDGKDGAPGKDGAAGKSAYQQAVDAGYTGTEAAFYAALVTLKDAPFLPESGGTMTGALNMGGKNINGILGLNSPAPYEAIQVGPVNFVTSITTDGGIPVDLGGCQVQGVDAPTNPTDAANKAYVDAETAKCLPLAGGTMTGALTFGSGRAGVYASGALLRFDSDSVSVMELADGQVTLLDGNTTISGVCSPALPKDAANKQYVDAETAGKAERKTATGTLSTAGWTGSAGNWSQAVTVSWMLAADVPKARLTGTTAAQMDAWDTLEPYVDSAAGKVTFYCKQAAKPSTAMSVGIEVIR